MNVLEPAPAHHLHRVLRYRRLLRPDDSLPHTEIHTGGLVSASDYAVRLLGHADAEVVLDADETFIGALGVEELLLFVRLGFYLGVVLVLGEHLWKGN